MAHTDLPAESAVADWRLLPSPIRLELGRVRYQSICQLVLPRSLQPDDRAAHWHADRKSGLSVRHDPDMIVISVPAMTIGRLAGRVSASADRGPVNLLIGASVSKGEAVQWPTPLSEEKARKLLASWAAEHPLVPNWLFEGPLQVRDASIARATVIVQRETVESKRHRAPQFPHLPRSDDAEQTSRLDAETWEDTSGEILVAGSEEQRECGDCDESHSTPCQNCAATGRVNCPTTAKCPDCDGSGQTLNAGGLVRLGLSRLGSDSSQSSVSRAFGAPDEYLDKCRTCSGQGRVTCPECMGAGQRACPECVQGRTPCATCGGDGRVAEFRTIAWHRTLETEVQISGDAALAEHSAEDTFQPLRPLDGDLLGGAPAEHGELRGWLDLKREEIDEDEVVRRIWVEVLPATAVTYSEGDVSRTAYLLGAKHIVYCPGAWHPSTARLLSTWKRARGHTSKKADQIRKGKGR